MLVMNLWKFFNVYLIVVTTGIFWDTFLTRKDKFFLDWLPYCLYYLFPRLAALLIISDTALSYNNHFSVETVQEWKAKGETSFQDSAI